ncbi:hypothetical protein EXU85_30005 [Spirosoma sp. KCTC 42546]|uniref:hypothetical protein n=1 Tax=Spirosoma sp. KCTC 42546 TaxID=2520506 RepID=UPI00115A8A41|nr:hypothetical protein [Spirosoma sp. KCTC 42546]QDK82616.1 hypothetical protein EXU85_30005 [Spirosoma sp. KCTC 42546]
METELKNNGCSDDRITVIFYDKYSKKNFEDILKHNNIIAIDILEFCLSISIEFLAVGTRIKSSKFDIDKILKSKIIYYPYNFESIYFDPIKNDSSYRFAKRQLAALVYFLESSFSSSANIINSPDNGRKWSNKLYQLESIAKFLPEYKLSSTLQSSYADSKLHSVIKHISESRQINKVNVSLSLKANKAVKTDLNQGVSLPYINQEFINEAFEYRCYVFGDESVLLRFSREGLPKDIVDIHYNNDLLLTPTIDHITHIHLTIIKKVHELTNLKMFAIDFFHSKNNNLRLLEINPLSSWYWLPKHARTAIDQAFIKFIKKV